MTHTLGSDTKERRPPRPTRCSSYEGALSGLALTGEHTWCYEGTEYESGWSERTLRRYVGAAMRTPTEEQVCAEVRAMFGGVHGEHTSQALLSMALAYERMCGGGEGEAGVCKVLREAAMKVAVIEALTV